MTWAGSIAIKREGTTLTVTKTDASGSSSKSYSIPPFSSDANVAVVSEGSLPSSTILIKSEH